MEQKIAPKEKGQSLVEMAVSFTFLLLLVGGIIDLGGMLYTYLALRDTAQEGVLYGASNPTNTAEIKNRILKSASFPIDASQLGASNITVTCSGGGACVANSITSCQGQKITVSVNYTYRFIMPLLGTFVGRPTVTLNASTTYTILQSDATVETLQALPTPQSCY